MNCGSPAGGYEEIQLPGYIFYLLSSVDCEEIHLQGCIVSSILDFGGYEDIFLLRCICCPLSSPGYEEIHLYGYTRGIHHFRVWCCHLYSSRSSAMQR
jgi:hypothetical protein